MTRRFGGERKWIIMSACLVILWPLLRPYGWLNFDAQIYALQSVAYLHPSRYANDLFFLYGSQDTFTALSRIVAPVYSWLGADHAALVLTLCAAAAWCAASLALARSLVGPAFAWLSLLVLFAMPGWYGGGGEVFRFAEGYFTARLPAEAVVVLALAVQQLGRRLPGAALLLIALALHPLMALPGIAVFTLVELPTRRWPWAIALACLAAGIAFWASLHTPIGRLTLVDSQWLQVIQMRNSYLFPSRWSLDDWRRAVTVGALLLAVLRISKDTRLRKIAGAAFLVGVTGVMVAWVGSDVYPVEIILQGQAWRALWLAAFLAALLTPYAAYRAWSSSPAGRVAATMLVTALCSVSAGAAMPAAVAAVALTFLPVRMKTEYARLLLTGAMLAFAYTVALSCLSIMQVVRIPVWGGADQALLERTRNILGLVAPAMLAVATLWALVAWRPTKARITLAIGLLATTGVAILPSAAREMVVQGYSGQRHDMFADWRQRIPPNSNVLWVDSPPSVWFVLERPSYMSIAQLSGVVFSRNLALKGIERARNLQPYVATSYLMGDPDALVSERPVLTVSALKEICADPELAFVVDRAQLAGNLLPHAWPDPSQRIYLYDCKDFR